MRFLLLTTALGAIAFAASACDGGGERTRDVDVFLSEMSRARAAAERPGEVLHVRRIRLADPFSYLDSLWVDVAAAQSRREVTATGEGDPSAGAWAVTVCRAGRCQIHESSGLARERPGSEIQDVLLEALPYVALADRATLNQTLDPWPMGGVDEETGVEFRSVGGFTRVQRGRWDGQAALVLEVATAYTWGERSFRWVRTVYLDPKSYLPLGEVEGPDDIPEENRERADYDLVEFVSRDSLPHDFFDPTARATPSP